MRDKQPHLAKEGDRRLQVLETAITPKKEQHLLCGLCVSIAVHKAKSMLGFGKLGLQDSAICGEERATGGYILAMAVGMGMELNIVY